jgi:hypothetical protein
MSAWSAPATRKNRAARLPILSGQMGDDGVAVADRFAIVDNVR